MPTQPTPFTLHLLGTPRVVAPDGSLVELPLGKPLAALCYLALEPSAVRRSDLARILWPSSTEPRARASIRQALWLLRKHTEAAAILEVDSELSLDTSRITLDLDALATALAEGNLERALELWDGGPLRGFGIPDAKPWLGWADEVRNRWEAQVGRALEERAEESTGEARAAWLEHALEVRPYRVTAWQALIRTRVELRDGEGADRALARLRQVADADDHDVVRDAEERVRLLHRAAYGDPDDRLVPDFVGRSEEFSVLMEAWRSALSARPRVVGLVGPAGIGKTALAGETARHVEVDGGTVVEARAVQTETTLDFGVVATVVANLLRRPGAAGTSPASAQVLRSLVPSEGDTAGPVPRSTTLADALADLLDAVSDEAPILLVVDDAHWIDASSAVVLLRAFRQLSGSRALTVWTCRDSNGPALSGLASLRAAAEQGSATLLTLEPLSLPEVQEMVTLLLSEADPNLLVDLGYRIHLASGGSPLHIVELLQGMRDQGHLGKDAEGRWVLADDIRWESMDLPDSLTEALGQRVLGLSDSARLLGAELASTTGAAAPTALNATGELTKPEVANALSELLERGLVAWTRDDRLRLTHETLAGALRVTASTDSGGPTVTRRPRWPWIAAGVAIAAVVAAAMFAPPPAAAPPPFGGGTIWLKSDVAAQAVRYAGGDEPWAFGDSILIPEGVSIQGIHEAVDGTVTMTGLTNDDPLRTPAAVMWRDGQLDTVFASSGDDSLVGFSPSGRGLLLHTQHADTTRYRQTVVVMDDETSRLQVVASGPQTYHSASWSPDGRRILLRVNAAWDSVRVSDPAGQFAVSRGAPYPELHYPRFCGSNAALLESPPPGEVATYYIWRFDEPDMRELRLSRESITSPACSPDGSAVVYVTETDEVRSLILETLDGTVVSDTPLPGDLPVRLHWTAPSLSPARVRIDPIPARLARGERLDANATVLDQTENQIARDVAWTSADPSVVSVRPSGRVTANRAGRTTIRAIVDGWMADSVEVEVTAEADSGRIAVSDSFAVLDTTKWIRLGDPDPDPTRTAEGDPALFLNGDGRFTDGIASWEEYDLSEGGTLEVDFWMGPFQRDDRNRIMVCLLDGDPGPDPTNTGDWVKRQEACVLWPPGEGVDFDPGSILLSVGRRAIGAVPIDTLLTTERWQRLSVQIRPDGEVSALVNDSLILVHPVTLRNDSTVRWHARVTGHSVDNTLLMRDLTLWEELRVHERPGGGP